MIQTLGKELGSGLAAGITVQAHLKARKAERIGLGKLTNTTTIAIGHHHQNHNHNHISSISRGSSSGISNFHNHFGSA